MKIIDENGITRECESVVIDKSFPGYVKASFVSKIRKGYKHFEWFPIEAFLEKNPSFKKQLGNNISEVTEDLGVVSKAGENFIQDLTKNWKDDIFVGITAWISRGKGEGQQRHVIKNDKNKFLVDSPWEIIPDRTSQYVLSVNIAKHTKAVGNNLPSVDTKQNIEKLIKKAKKSVLN